MYQRPRRRDARCCPDCGARGILPLDQPHTPEGGIEDPIMICPICETEFRAVGATWLGAIRPPQDWETQAEEAKSEAAQRIAEIWSDHPGDSNGSAGNGPPSHEDDDFIPLIDPTGGPAGPTPEFEPGLTDTPALTEWSRHQLF